MAKKGHKRIPPAGQGTLFGPADVYGGVKPAAPAPARVPPAEPPPWDHGLAPPTPEELAALHAAHPGVMLLFRHPCGCAFHGDDALVAHDVAGLPLCGPEGAPSAGWRHGDFPGPMRLLLAAGRRVCVVERGEGLPAGHRLGACPVVTSPPYGLDGTPATGARCYQAGHPWSERNEKRREAGRNYGTAEGQSAPARPAP